MARPPPDPTKIQIVKGQSTEIPIAGALFEAAFDQPHGAPAIADLLKQPGSFLLIALWHGEDEADPMPCGFVVGAVIAGESEIFSVGVAPPFRGRHVGDRLITRFLEVGQANGAGKAFLEVATDNHPARQLYARHGFATVGTRKNYYIKADGTRQDAAIMRRDLPS